MLRKENSQCLKIILRTASFRSQTLLTFKTTAEKNVEAQTCNFWKQIMGLEIALPIFVWVTEFSVLEVGCFSAWAAELFGVWQSGKRKRKSSVLWSIVTLLRINPSWLVGGKQQLFFLHKEQWLNMMFKCGALHTGRHFLNDFIYTWIYLCQQVLPRQLSFSSRELNVSSQSPWKFPQHASSTRATWKLLRKTTGGISHLSKELEYVFCLSNYSFSFSTLKDSWS